MRTRLGTSERSLHNMIDANTPGEHGGTTDDSSYHAAFGETRSSRSDSSEYSNTQSRSEPAPFAAGMDTDSSSGPETDSGTTRKRSRGRGRRKSSARSATAETVDDGAHHEDPEASATDSKPSTRKRSRRRKKASSSSEDSAVAEEATNDPDQEEAPARKPRARRAKRGSRSRNSEESGSGDERLADEDRSELDAEEKPARKSRRRGGRSRKTEESASEDERPASEDSSFDAEEKPARKSRRRGGRSRKTEEDSSGDERPASEDGSELDAEEKPARKSRRRGSRGRRKKTSTEDEPRDSEDSAESQDSTDEPSTKKTSSRRRGKRGGRGRSRSRSTDDAVPVDVIPGEFDDLPELPELPEDTEVLEEPAGRGGRRSKAKATKKKTRKKASKKRGRRGEADADAELDDYEEQEEERTGLILVNSLDHDEQRVAVVEDGKIVDFDMNVETKHSHVGDIYRGRVVNLESAIGAAFVDFGRGRNGFLHTSDVLQAYGEKDWNLEKLLTTQVDPEEWESESSQPSVAHEIDDGDEESPKSDSDKKSRKKSAGKKPKFRARPRLPISDLLKKGQQVVVQVTKDAIGDKGPTLTTYISIPGRYLVLMPSMARRGVSRKIEDDKERRRLKRIVDTLKAPDGMGVIVRTAGVGRTKIALKRDLEYLLGVWETFGRRLRIGSGPAALYQESDVAIRTMRDLYSSNIEAVIVDDEKTHQGIVEFAERLMPEAVERVKLHGGPRPLFHTHGVEQDYEKIFSRRVELPSGGSIVLDQTEALVAIDVNSGRTRSKGFDFEAIALKTNMEAVPEIARQIRLRDLGGIIVVDFIDMMKRPNMRTVEKAFRDEMAKDRARSKLGRISQFGLLEMTRQRLGPGLDKKVFTTCPRCRGTARVRTVESRASAILRRLGSALTLKGFSRVEVRAHPEVVDFLQSDCQPELERLKSRHQRELSFTAVVDQPEDSVLRYLRTDGREVRPGGRRKN